MVRNLLSSRLIRISTWIAVGLSLLAIGLIVTGLQTKGDVGLHLTMWGIQLLFAAIVMAIIAAMLLGVLYGIIQLIGQKASKLWFSKGRDVSASHNTLAAIMDEKHELHILQDKETPWGTEGLSAQAHYHWHPLDYDAARAVGVYSRPWLDNEHDQMP